MELVTNQALTTVLDLHGVRKPRKRKGEPYVKLIEHTGGGGCAQASPPACKKRCALGIKYSVTVQDWNCKTSNVANVLSCIGHLDEEMEQKVIWLSKTVDAYKTNIARTGYEVIQFQGVTSCTVLALIERPCLPGILTTTLLFSPTATYGHTFGVCPFLENQNSEWSCAFIDGSNGNKDPIPMSQEGLHWFCSNLDVVNLQFSGFFFFPGHKRTLKILRRIADQGPMAAETTTVCFRPSTIDKEGKGSKHFDDIASRNVVRGNYEFYDIICKEVLGRVTNSS